jgi:hypothetical protein
MDALPVRRSILATAAILAAILAMPGQTIVASYINDLFIFLDGAQRIAAGQVPNRDFQSALGPLSFYIPALGFWITEDMGRAMPSGMAAATLVLALPITHILASRLQPAIAIPYGIFLLLILVVPQNLGESITELSFAMFYNRIGWAALGALLVMYLRPVQARSGQHGLDMICAVTLTMTMLYTKITYGLVAIAFLVFLLSDKRQRPWAAGAIALLLVGLLSVEIFWRSSTAYIDDIAIASAVSGSRSVADLAGTFLKNLADYVMFGMLAALAVWRTRSIRNLIFFGFCALPGLLIQNQNAQPWGIMTLHAGAVVAVVLVLCEQPPLRQAQTARLFAYGAPLLLLLLILPTLLHNLTVLGFHATLSVARAGEAFKLPRLGNIRLISPWLSNERTLMHRYLASVEEGARGLERLPTRPKKVFVLDFVNPFSAGLDLIPPHGGSTWLHWGRNINASNFIPAETMFADVDVLMVPKWGINSIPLQGLYQSYIEDAFEPVTESTGWIIYRRRSSEVASKSGSFGARERLAR